MRHRPASLTVGSKLVENPTDYARSRSRGAPAAGRSDGAGRTRSRARTSRRTPSRQYARAAASSSSTLTVRQRRVDVSRGRHPCRQARDAAPVSTGAAAVWRDSTHRCANASSSTRPSSSNRSRSLVGHLVRNVLRGHRVASSCRVRSWAASLRIRIARPIDSGSASGSSSAVPAPSPADDRPADTSAADEPGRHTAGRPRRSATPPDSSARRPHVALTPSVSLDLSGGRLRSADRSQSRAWSTGSAASGTAHRLRTPPRPSPGRCRPGRRAAGRCPAAP